MTFIEGSMEVELMVTKCDNQPTTTTDRVNIEQSASGRWALGRQSFAIQPSNYSIQYQD